MMPSRSLRQPVAGFSRLLRAGVADDVPVHNGDSRRAEALVGVAEARPRGEISEMLSRLGFAVSAEADGFRLIERIADAILGKAVERPALIIADALLPGCTGLSLLGGLRDLGWQTPVILLSPRSPDAARWQAWSSGVSGVFTAPYDMDELHSFVLSLLNHGGDDEQRIAS